MAIALQETVTGGLGDGGGNSFTLTSWTPGSNELVLVAVSKRDETITTTCSGNGLTFVEVFDVNNIQDRGDVNLFRAMGASPSTGQITVTVTGNSLPVSAVAMRFSGIDTSGTNGSGAVEVTATDAGPVTDNDDLKISITTLTDDAWALACSFNRDRTFTVPGGQSSIVINQSYGASDEVRCSTWYDERPTAGAVTLGADNSLSAADDWCVGAVSIKPSTTDLSVTAADAVTVAGTAVVAVQGAGPSDLSVSVADAITVGDAATLLVQAAGEYSISVTDQVAVTDAVVVQLQPLHSPSSDALTVSDAATVEIGSQAAEDPTGADDYTLSIEDGDWAIHLTHDERGMILLGNDGWRPVTANFKAGGYYSAGSMADGRQLRHTAFDNVVETFSVKLDFPPGEADDMLAQLDRLDEMLKVRAPRYWTDRRCHKPVWIKRRLKGETDTAYTLVNQGRVTLPADFWDSCTHNTGMAFPVLITVDRQPFWLGAQPGTTEADVEISALQQWGYAYTWSVETTLPAGDVFCFVEDYQGNIWAGGSSEILQWNGSAWSVASTAPVALAGDVEACALLGNGDILFGDDGQVVKRSLAGVWSVETALPAGQVTALLGSSAGEVFAGEDGVIWKRDTSGVWAEDTSDFAGGMWAFAEDARGRVLVGSDQQILAQVDPWDAAEGVSLTVLLDSEDDSAEQYNQDVYVPGVDRRLRWFNRNIVGLRYELDVPAGAAINSCILEGMLRSSVEGTDDDEEDEDPEDDDDASEWMKVYCEADDDASVFAESDNDLSGRVRTTNYVAWQDDEDHKRGAYIAPGDLSQVLQEVIDRPGWEEGSHVAFLLVADNSTWSQHVDSHRPVYNYDSDRGAAPRLRVTYTTTDGSSGEWEVVTTLPAGAVRSLLITDQLTLAGDDGQVLGSDDGYVFSVLDTTPSGETRALYQDRGSDVWAGDNGNVLRSTDGGRSFSVDDTLPAGYVNAFIEETVTGDLRAGDNGQVLVRSLDDSLNLGGTKTELDYIVVGNLHRTSNLTHVKLDNGGVFTDAFPINPVTGYPADLLPDPFAGNDAAYFGTNTALSDTSHFTSLVFDIATPASSTGSYGIAWEYWSGSAWTTLTVRDETNQFSEVSVNGVFWKTPADWATTTVDSVTGWWVRARVSSLTGTPTTPTQQGRNVYTASWSHVTLRENVTAGNVPALAQMRVRNRADAGGPGGSEPQLYVNRVLAGIKRTEDHAEFRAFLNFADEQNPPGVTVDLSVDPDGATSIQDDLSSAAGRRIFFDASVAQSGNGLDNWEDRVAIRLGPTVARDFYGTYKIFLRLKQNGGSAGQVNVRFKLSSGSGGISHITEPQETRSTADHELVEFDAPVTLPVSAQMVPSELGDQTTITVQVNAEAADADLFLYDLGLIPTDEVWVDLVDRANTAESTLESGRRLLVDSVTIPKFPTRALIQDLTSGSVVADWSVDGNGDLRLPARTEVRLWFLLARTSSTGSDVWLSEPEMACSIMVAKTDRWLLGRSDAS